MDVPSVIRGARLRAGLTQAQLARRAGTSQATLSAYENGRKQPSLETVERLLAGCGARLAVSVVRDPSPQEHERVARAFSDVLALAERLPTRHERELRYPRLPASGR